MASHVQHAPSGRPMWIAGTAMVCLLACATRDRAPSANAAPPPVASVPVPAAKPAQNPSGPISSPCVLHTSQVKRQVSKVRLPDGGALPGEERGSCSADAECIASHGQETPGDGFVYLACTERTCTCSIEPAAPSRAKPNKFTFEISSPCTTSDRAFQHLIEQCMSGMTVIKH